MKFCKNLRRVINITDPAWAPFWMNYKLLKKLIKELPTKSSEGVLSTARTRTRTTTKSLPPPSPSSCENPYQPSSTSTSTSTSTSPSTTTTMTTRMTMMTSISEQQQRGDTTSECCRGAISTTGAGANRTSTATSPTSEQQQYSTRCLSLRPPTMQRLRVIQLPLLLPQKSSHQRRRGLWQRPSPPLSDEDVDVDDLPPPPPAPSITSSIRHSTTTVKLKEVLGHSPAEVAFFKALHGELKKAQVFFDQATTELEIREERIRQGISFTSTSTSTSSSNRQSSSSGPTRPTRPSQPPPPPPPPPLHPHPHPHHQHRSKWRAIDQAVFVLYKDVLLLETYAILSYVGFSKILKKHDKVTGYDTCQSFMTSMVHPANLTHYPKIVALIGTCKGFWDTLEREGKRGGPLSEDEELFVNMIHRLNDQVRRGGEQEEISSSTTTATTTTTTAATATTATTTVSQSKDENDNPGSGGGTNNAHHHTSSGRLKVADQLRQLVEENERNPSNNNNNNNDDDDDDDDSEEEETITDLPAPTCTAPATLPVTTTLPLSSKPAATAFRKHSRRSSPEEASSSTSCELQPPSKRLRPNNKHRVF